MEVAVRLKSTKKVKPLDEVLGQRLFIIPASKSNEIDLITGERCVFVQINGKPHYVRCDTPTPMPYNVFCVLRDIGFMEKSMEYGDGDKIL